MKKIAIFIGKSLLTQGALSYIKSHPENGVEICSVDISNPQAALEQLKSFTPDIIMVESQYLSDPLFTPSAILELFPHLVMLELHVDSPSVRIIRSEQRKPASFEELISTLGIINSTITPVPQV